VQVARRTDFRFRSVILFAFQFVQDGSGGLDEFGKQLVIHVNEPFVFGQVALGVAFVEHSPDLGAKTQSVGPEFSRRASSAWSGGSWLSGLPGPQRFSSADVILAADQPDLWLLQNSGQEAVALGQALADFIR